jgi:hypothetical protein
MKNTLLTRYLLNLPYLSITSTSYLFVLVGASARQTAAKPNRAGFRNTVLMVCSQHCIVYSRSTTQFVLAQSLYIAPLVQGLSRYGISRNTLVTYCNKLSYTKKACESLDLTEARLVQ